MSAGTDYVRRCMDKALSVALLDQVGKALPVNTSPAEVVRHLIDHGMIPDHYALHYLIWRAYRELLSTTTRTPADIMAELAATHEVDVRTIERIVKKMTAPVVIKG
jgi:hypothetical protein